jgi:hypothetical protein
MRAGLEPPKKTPKMNPEGQKLLATGEKLPYPAPCCTAT